MIVFVRYAHNYMNKYLTVLVYYSQRISRYPLEGISKILIKILGIVFVLVFWSLILKGGKTDELLAYFLISSGIGEMLFVTNTKLGRTIRKSVTTGEISNVIIKPVSVVGFLYLKTIGDTLPVYLFSIFSVVMGILSLKLPLEKLPVFAIFFVLAGAISFAFNLFEGALSIIFTEVSGIKNAINHTTRILSGALIPLAFFPWELKNIVELLPFGSMIYSPVNSITMLDNFDFAKSFFVGVFWAVLLNFVMYKFWIYSFRKFESAGI